MMRKPTGSGFLYFSYQILSLHSWTLHRPVLRMAMVRFESNFAEILEFTFLGWVDIYCTSDVATDSLHKISFIKKC
jgi:hypothetical protein